jgi:intracellular septation protein
MSAPAKTPHISLIRLALDFGPLAVFFAAFKFFGIFAATAVFMVAALAAVAVEYWRERRVAPMPLLTAGLVLVLGGLTLYSGNPVFIKMKPTVLYAFFGVLLMCGLAFNRFFIKYVLAQVLELSDAGWRTLTWRWGVFFFVLAGLNELVWRHFSTPIWVDFKVFGVIPLFFLFAIAQTPLIMKHEIQPDPKQETE